MNSMRMVWSIALMSLAAGALSCRPIGETGIPVDPAFLLSCNSAPQLTDPQTASVCAGPDADGWSNQPRADDAGPCPPPPANGCTQVVIGRLSDTAAYIGCPGYIVLNRSDWTIDLNDAFISCVSACELGTCDPPVIVVSRREEIPEFDVDYTNTTVTSRELCELARVGCTVTFADDDGPGVVECGCSHEGE